MTELKFALGTFLGCSSKRGLEVAGEEYKMLREMRPLLFLDTASFASPTHAANLAPLVVLHHVIVRSPLPLPHTIHRWQETKYVRLVEEHVWDLVEATLFGKEGQFVDLARRMLSQVRDVRGKN